MQLKRTPLYNEHIKLGAKTVEFGGWEMPVYYSNVIEEHLNVREKAGLFDICHMGELFVEGNDAFKLVQKLITNDLNKLEDGKAFYSSMCNEKGGIIDDLFVYRFNDKKFMVVVNAVNAEKDFRWFLRNKDFFDDAVILNKTDEIAKFDLQGPKAEEVLQRLTNFDLKKLKRFYFVEKYVNGVHSIISRTGYTGEDGFELYFDSEKAAQQWNKILEIGKESGVKPIGLGARDTLRIEVGYSLYGHELSEEINPFEAGTGFTVKLDKGDFIGKEALSRAKDNINRRIVAFEMIDRGIPRHDYEVYKGDEKIGNVTSGTLSPTFKRGVGMAMLSTEQSFQENEIHIKIREKLYKAKIVKRPIYNFCGNSGG